MNNGEFLLSVVEKFDLENGDWSELHSSNEENMVLKMYKPNNSRKKYLFFWNNQQPMEQLDKVDKLITESIDYAIIPQDTYLILFSEVGSLDEAHYKQIIEVEENEFRYKKYVCYYTSNELEELKRQNEDIFNIKDNFFKVYPNFRREDSFVLLYRMIIKIPIIKMAFEKKELEDFQELYEMERKATSAFTIKQIVTMENKIIPNIPNEEKFEEAAVKLIESFIDDIYGGELDEYLS
ncbi:ABC-three component system middle component 1 [Listeria welshimeri]|uniref:ABC-three component system middle component 1 n=1 Tax=Listeria welshimeri TaxID=1643 RepID=UPI001889BA32|nr:ABC-three component system middle component 1 [Listeria welshimeri]MBF2342250.1 hypothetical protein [Listeria welshimeri]MBF2380399.1 hypothetical protein [Listeria welshimeri]